MNDYPFIYRGKNLVEIELIKCRLEDAGTPHMV